jgi:hypothetical protein
MVKFSLEAFCIWPQARIHATCIPETEQAGKYICLSHKNTEFNF